MIRAALMLLCLLPALLAAAETKTLYVQVILATDDSKPAGPPCREIGPKLSAKLSPVFRWKHYWETDRKKVEFDPRKSTRIELPNQRTLEIEKLKTGELEVRLLRRRGLLTKTRQSSRTGMAILGGEEPGKDSFFVVVRPDEPTNRE